MTAVPPRPRAVVFDVGGVLVHVDPDVMAESIGRAVGRPIIRDACAVSLQLAADDAYALGVTDQDPRVRLRWADRLGVRPHEADAAWRALLDCDVELWTRVDPDATAVLGTLRRAGLRLAILSNANGDLARTLTRLGLREPFEVVVDSGVAGVAKPDPRAFALAPAGLGLPAADCWYVGDSIAEVEAAVACGYGHGVAYTVAGAARAPAARVPVVDRLTDLTVLLAAASPEG